MRLHPDRTDDPKDSSGAPASGEKRTGFLVLKVKPGDKITIGNQVLIYVAEEKGQGGRRMKLAIQAGNELKVTHFKIKRTRIPSSEG